MLLPNGVEISHPFFARISCEPQVCEVELSDAFPAWLRKFQLRPAPPIWDGCHEVESNLGMFEDGHLCWLAAGGHSYEEAISVALGRFLNWVVHPDDIVESNFVFRELS